MKFSRWAKAIAVTMGVLCIASATFAQGRGSGRGMGGGPGEETTANSLSVPAILIGDNPFGLTTDGIAVYPEDEGIDPISGFPIDPSQYFYVQGVHRWQASCLAADPEDVPVAVGAAWGDNLTGEARLKTNSPIRVEMGLLADPESYGGMTGWDVGKLEPDKLDREAAYGTPATLIGGVFESSPLTPYDEVRVYDAYAWLKIYNLDNPDDPIVDGPAGAEINSTGRIVYGHNLRVNSAGTYVIEFTAPNVDIIAYDAGTVSDDGTMIALEINVTSGGGGGGGGGPRRPNVPPGQVK